MSNNQILKFRKKPHLLDLNFLEKAISNLPQSSVTSNVVDVSEKIRVFPKDSPFPGKHRYSRTPYMYEIAMELSPQSVTEIVNFMKAAQLGATANSTESLILFCIAENPMPILAMVPTEEFLKKWDNKRIMPMIKQSGVELSSSYKKNSQHGGKGDAVGRKTWTGGSLDIITFGQTNQLRNQSYAICILEDAEELVMTMQKGGGQGDFKKVAFARTKTYTGRRKILDISTPIFKHNSHIEREFKKGDMRYYYIDCPKCGFSQRLLWDFLKFEKDQFKHVIKESVYYECQDPNCLYHMKEEEKEDFLLCEELGGTARWIPTNTDKAEPLTKSYQISTLYAGAGFDTWYDLAKQWVSAQNNPEELQAFVNLVLGEPYENRAEAPPANVCAALKGVSYKKGQLPNKKEGGILFTVIGADVQQGNKRDGKWLKGKLPRIEASLWGFGLNGRRWLLDHYIITGETTDYRSGAFLKFRNMIEGNVFPIPPVRILIDSRFQTDQVRAFCNGSGNIIPVMGQARIKKGTFNRVELPGYVNSLRLPLAMYELNNNSLKSSTYSDLVIQRDPLNDEVYPPRYMMFPYDLEAKYFEQLTSERGEKIIKNGRVDHVEWISHGANETFDCALYAFQGANIYMHETSLSSEEEATNREAFWQFIKDNPPHNTAPTQLELIKKHKLLLDILNTNGLA